MLKIEGSNPHVINTRVEHHVQKLRPIITTLVMELVFNSKLTTDSRVHTIKQSRGGPNSFSLVTADGDEYHFRICYGAGEVFGIEVRDSYTNGNTIAQLWNTAQASNFIRKLSKSL